MGVSRYKAVDAKKYGVTKQDLKDLKFYKMEVKRIRGEIAELEDMTAGINAWDVTDRINELLLKKEKRRKELIEALHVYLDKLEAIDKFFNELCERDKMLLTLLYVDGLSWYKSLEMIGLSHNGSNILDTFKRLRL